MAKTPQPAKTFTFDNITFGVYHFTKRHEEDQRLLGRGFAVMPIAEMVQGTPDFENFEQAHRDLTEAATAVKSTATGADMTGPLSDSMRIRATEAMRRLEEKLRSEQLLDVEIDRVSPNMLAATDFDRLHSTRLYMHTGEDITQLLRDLTSAARDVEKNWNSYVPPEEFTEAEPAPAVRSRSFVSRTASADPKALDLLETLGEKVEKYFPGDEHAEARKKLVGELMQDFTAKKAPGTRGG